MSIYYQRHDRYQAAPLGRGVGGATIGRYGCYLLSLARGLALDPLVLNQELLNRKLWDNNNYIVVSQLATHWSEKFLSFRTCRWQTISYWRELIDNPSMIVLAKVSAKGIGGTGSHFVQGVGYHGANAMIYDPWHDDIIKVAQRYNRWDNITGLRIFHIKL